MEQAKGKLIVIVAPSGTGKSTLIARLKKDVSLLHWSVSCTTRPIRPGEIDGVNYFFITPEEFEKKLDKNQFVEWAVVHSNYYGTSKEFVDAGLKKGDFLLFDLDVQGADQIKQMYKEDAQVIFIAPPSVDDLKSRLMARGTDSREVIEERLSNAISELEKKDSYDYLVINDDLENAYQRLKKIVLSVMDK